MARGQSRQLIRFHLALGGEDDAGDASLVHQRDDPLQIDPVIDLAVGVDDGDFIRAAGAGAKKRQERDQEGRQTVQWAKEGMVSHSAPKHGDEL